MYKVSQQEIDASPTISLAGKEWHIPLLAPRQQRTILPLAVTLSKLDPATVTEGEYDALLRVTHSALTRAYPELSYDEFLDMSIGTMELLAGLDTIMYQTGLLQRKGDGTNGSAPGEPVARNLTGTSSLPM